MCHLLFYILMSKAGAIEHPRCPNFEMQNLLTRMAAAEGHSAGSTSLTISADTPILTIVALALAAVSCSVLLCNTLPLTTQPIYPHVSLSATLIHCHVLEPFTGTPFSYFLI